MTLPRAYAPIFPEFDAFLFASVGEEVDGVPLSVLSALARLGLDPREEAARLAHLTREAAVDQLARMIARLYDQRWSASEAWRIASGLVERLPMMGGAAAKDGRAAPGTKSTIGFRSPSFLIYLALALAMLVGLVASGYLSLGG
jgi:hypothetical protein